jgi:hypothetical protein
MGDRFNVAFSESEQDDNDDDQPESIVFASIRYTLDSTSYFNTPSTIVTGEDLQKEPEAFEYRLVAVSPDGSTILAESNPVLQSIHVVHVNHPSTLSSSVKTLTLANNWDKGLLRGAAPSSGRLQNTIALEDPQDYDNGLCPRRYFRHPRGTERRGTILSLGAVSGHLYWLWWTRHSVALCWKSGERIKTMRILAMPSNVGLILSDILYEAHRFGKSGEITIQVYDGNL